MTYIIVQPCIGEKDASCVDVCPVDCIYEGEDQFYIHPEECIDCGACVPECPVDAIFSEADLPDNWAEYLELNARLAPDWPEIAAQKDPLPDADEFKDVQNKRDMLDESAGGPDKPGRTSPPRATSLCSRTSSTETTGQPIRQKDV